MLRKGRENLPPKGNRILVIFHIRGRGKGRSHSLLDMVVTLTEPILTLNGNSLLEIPVLAWEFVLVFALLWGLCTGLSMAKSTGEEGRVSRLWSSMLFLDQRRLVSDVGPEA